MTLSATAPARVGRWAPGGPFSLAQTLGIVPRGPGDRTVIATAAGTWLAFTTADGPATLLLRQDGPPRQPVVHFQAWGPGAQRALDSVPALLGAADDWSGFDHPDFAATLPRLVSDARRRNPAVRLPATGRMVDALVPAVLEQKVTSVEARRGYRYLLSRFGTRAPAAAPDGPAPAALTVAPTPAAWAQIPSWEWHRAGVGPQRSATVMRVMRVADGLERLATADAETASQKLQTIVGVGCWTAAEVTQRTHSDADAISVGDYHLASYVGWALLGRPVDDAGMLELLEPWRGHRQRVVRMIMLSGFRKPTFGPRMTIQDHRRQ
ncbi:MAG TPA: 3-methyladenine DNA glycosylase [Micrococcaceae bacterium]